MAERIEDLKEKTRSRVVKLGERVVQEEHGILLRSFPKKPGFRKFPGKESALELTLRPVFLCIYIVDEDHEVVTMRAG